VFYSFDQQLTTDQKIALLDEWLDGAKGALSALAPDGLYPDPEQYRWQASHIESLQTWRRLVEVEEELAASRADTLDPDPEGDRMQEAWCRMARLMLKVASVHVRLRAEKSKPAPDAERIGRLSTRSNALFKKLFIAQETTAGFALLDAAQSLDYFECEGGDSCSAVNPCASCASRAALREPGGSR
jgi:hypothetical protein